MLVCHCKAVPERVVRAAIDAGAADVLSVALACGAGTDCGGCVPTIAALLDRSPAQPVSPSPVQQHRVAVDRVQQLGVAAGPGHRGALGLGHAG